MNKESIQNPPPYSIAIYCGSSVGNDPKFAQEAISVGNLLVELGIGLVYGGGGIGIMGQIATTMHNQNGYVHGIIPRFLFDREVAFSNCTKLTITESMHERKAIIAEDSDIFMALPGGFGTLDELMEIITWKQLNLHQKPIIIYNVFGFYDELLVTIEKLSENGFINPDTLNIYEVISTKEELKDYLSTYIQSEHKPHIFIKERS